MAKMMMGQIDHARKRVQKLKIAKYGPGANKPNLKDADDLIERIRAGKIKITSAMLKKAFDTYINKTRIPFVKKDSGSYQNNYVTTYSVETEAPSSVEQALAALIYQKENAKAIDKWHLATELYKTRKEAIDLKATEVEDAIVLGDQEAALKAIKEFTEFEV